MISSPNILELYFGEDGIFSKKTLNIFIEHHIELYCKSIISYYIFNLNLNFFLSKTSEFLFEDFMDLYSKLSHVKFTVRWLFT